MKKVRNRSWANRIICAFMLIIFIIPTLATTAFAADVTGLSSSITDYLKVTYSGVVVLTNRNDTSNTGATGNGATVNLWAKSVSVFGNPMARRTTVTFTIKSGAPDIAVAYTTSGCDTASGKAELSVNGTTSFSIVLTSSGDNTTKYEGSVTITSITEAGAAIPVNFVGDTGGTYTVSGGGFSTAQTVDSTFTAAAPKADSIQASTTYTLTATESSTDYVFLGWVSTNKGLFSESKSVTYTTDVTDTIRAIFGKNTSGKSALYHVKGTVDGYYAYLDEAADNAADGVIVLHKTGFVYGEDSNSITIPSNVTLLLPYAEGQTTVDASTETVDGSDSTYIHANKHLHNSNTASPSAHFTANRFNMNGEYLRLTVPNGTTIENAGLITVGGTLGYVNGNGIQNVPLGGTDATNNSVFTYSVLELDSGATIKVASTGKLSVCGYILGDGTINVTGGKVYQPITIHDYWGGAGTVAAAGQDKAITPKTYADANGDGVVDNGCEEYLPPFTVYTMQNIQADMQISNSGSVIAYSVMYTGAKGLGDIVLIPARYNVTEIVMIGPSSALIQTNANTIVNTTFDSTTYATVGDNGGSSNFGKTTITITGGADFGSTSMKLNVNGSSYTVNSNDATWPVPFTYDIHLNGQGSTYNIRNSLAVMPGAALTVGEGATLNIGAAGTIFAVYDGLYSNCSVQASTSCSVTFNQLNSGIQPYPHTSALKTEKFHYGRAEFKVNGTLNVENGHFGGIIQTDGTGTVAFSAAATPSCSTQCGRVGTVNIISNYAFAGATVTTLDARINLNGTLSNVEAGKTYVGIGNDELRQTDYSFTFYSNSDGTNSEQSVNYAACGITGGSPFCGKWICETHTGVDTDHVCDVCGFVTACVDENTDHLCDVCGSMTDCVDTDGDYICDVCGKALYMTGWTSQLYLIEPWALRLNLVVVDANTKEQIDNVSVDSFYFLRSSDLGNAEVTVDTIKNHAKTTIYSGSDIHTQKLEQYEYTWSFADYKEGIYTYQMDEDIYAMASFRINGGEVQYALSGPYNLKELLDDRKDKIEQFGEKECAVYTAMYNLWEGITAYREGKSDSFTEMGTLLTENQLGEYKEQTDYRFGVRNQIVLIEPWGLQVNAAIVPGTASSVDEHVDYSKVDDYGVVMFYDVGGTYEETPSAETLLGLTGQAYVFSSGNGAFVNSANDCYIAARYNRDVYTYQLNTNVYALYFVKVNGVYYYSNVRTYNVYDLATARSEDASFDELERAVYAAMVQLYDAITVYRAQYATN